MSLNCISFNFSQRMVKKCILRSIPRSFICYFDIYAQSFKNIWYIELHFGNLNKKYYAIWWLMYPTWNLLWETEIFYSHVWSPPQICGKELVALDKWGVISCVFTKMRWIKIKDQYTYISIHSWKLSSSHPNHSPCKP